MTNNRPNPDNRADNVEKLQDMIENTLDNIDKSEETMAFASSEERANIEAKNKRREESIDAFREEVKDEAANRENGYQ
ncbi:MULTISPECIES: small acid-soluble spore protein Tlp [unclassified Niallia]|uniref:small acid-soluble spore protein Tlp n=1 Tax=unclassified Niallia TaxID=2837522 RepID=UPI001EDB00DF|nr:MULTISPECIES: small acid-soluble spore protein Tlp [unclassified Niallia]MDL0435292.1 small acid-soluble spore protein Tlp [Niallia sp. SS-2023]UPO86950.1 small acid-soluble spore protein Tlp [Niallia sp. Man26]